jgi:single-stranded-DNA-specific exonuclease
MNHEPNWQLPAPADVPDWFVQAVRGCVPNIEGHYAAQLLWQRGLRDPQKLAGYVDPAQYVPASPFEFGEEMQWGVKRLQQAYQNHEKVAIWGDFDADGVTATAVLWEGLGQFFRQSDQLSYYIPNRLYESHGLNMAGIEVLAKSGVGLIVTCDTGSTNVAEIEYAGSLGIDVIVSDHHTLPAQRPPVVAIINPRALASEHPLAHLSGVAVAYKLVEALYQTLPNIPQQPLESLLDLVAIGLIADLVQLSGDCRYLAQLGIKQLQRQQKEKSRPGVARLLELCKRNGDRPTDISFGIGPRINAVSRIQGDARFCVELLTSRDEKRCNILAMETELANARRQSLQKDVTQKVKAELEKLDLSTTCVIVLVDQQWPAGVLGLVAGQIAQEYGRPTVLLSTEGASADETIFARGSARSVNNIDLYELVQKQSNLLHRFGGHPFAAGMSLPVENVPLFRDGINRQLREELAASESLGTAIVQIDLIVSVAELGQSLFREIRLLEPCGMGNPVPKLLIQNCWFEKAWNRNIEDRKGGKVSYIRTKFEIWDNSTNIGFPGIWWGHYKDELPPGRCDAIVELDYNTYDNQYEVRLIEVHSSQENIPDYTTKIPDWVIDYRGIDEISEQEFDASILVLNHCPSSWDELQNWVRNATRRQQKLALAYPPPQIVTPLQIWQQLVGIAKYLSRTEEPVSRHQICEKLHISHYLLHLGLQTLNKIGFEIVYLGENLKILQSEQTEQISDEQFFNYLIPFISATEEEQFRRQYFYQMPVSMMEGVIGNG